MKKGIAFLLAAVMCLGLVGCELPGMGLARNIVGKTASVDAEEVYEALAKIGELVLDTKYDSTTEPSGVDKIVFRMPKEERQTSIEKACYIRVYPSQKNLKAAKRYAKIGNEWLYASGNVLLELDGNISADSVQKYVDALKKLTNDNVHKWNDQDPKVEKSSRKKSFMPPNGFGANEAYEILKKELNSLEFASFRYMNDLECITFWDRASSGIGYVTVRIEESDEKALAHAKFKADEMKGSKRSQSVLVSGNVVIELSESTEELFLKYSNALEKITGKPVNMEYSTRTES